MKSKVIEIFKKYGEEIKKDYKSNDVSERKALAKKYNISYNSLLLVLELLGFNTTEWSRKKAEKMIATLKKRKLNYNEEKSREVAEILK